MAVLSAEDPQSRGQAVASTDVYSETVMERAG